MLRAEAHLALHRSIYSISMTQHRVRMHLELFHESTAYGASLDRMPVQYRELIHKYAKVSLEA